MECSRAAQKSALRQQFLAQRRQMGATARAAAAQRICEKIRRLPQYQQARCIAAFAPMNEEVDIWQLITDCINAQKTVAVPRVASKARRQLTFHHLHTRAQLQSGCMGILEPAAEEKIISQQEFDFILVPAVAIDKNKKRLGYGGGFYDTVLANCRDTHSCAPVFRCQLAEVLPCEKHDQSVQFVISD